MISIITDNLANIIISAVLLGFAALAVIKIRKDKRNGCHNCNCNKCPSSNMCSKVSSEK